MVRLVPFLFSAPSFKTHGNGVSTESAFSVCTRGEVERRLVAA
jgi:hypothetical protein